MRWFLIFFMVSFFSTHAESKEFCKKTCSCVDDNWELYRLWYYGDSSCTGDLGENCRPLVGPGWQNFYPDRRYYDTDKQYETAVALYHAHLPASTRYKKNYGDYKSWINSRGFNLYTYTSFLINEVFAREQCNIDMEWTLASADVYHASRDFYLKNAENNYIEGHEKISTSMKKARKLLRELYIKCRKEHRCLKTAYEYGLLSQHLGDYAQSAELMTDYAHMAGELDAATPISPEAYTLTCHSLFSALDYDKAIALLTEAIKKYPDKKELYELRIAAYLELGKFNEAAEDYITQNFDQYLSPDPNKALLAAFFLRGGAKGCADGIREFPLSLLSSLRGTGLMLWTTVSDPLSVPAIIMNCVEETIAVLREGDGKILEQIAPELHDIVKNWDSLSPEHKWEQIGHFYGKYGFDILACTGSAKLLKLSQSLRTKTSLCNIKANILSSEKKVAVIAEQIAVKRNAFFENSRIQWDKQGKHIEGHNSWKNLEPDIRAKKSLLTHKDPEKLLREYAGKGSPTPNQKGKFGEVGYKENVDFKEIIGIWKNEEGTEAILTTRGRIYYDSKGKAHIVPIQPVGR
jgi:hypothetical protein